MKTTLPLLAFSGLLTVASHAVTVVPIVEVYAHNEFSNFTQGEDDMINGSGMNGNPQTGDAGWPTGAGLPATWTTTDNGYQSEWQSGNQLSPGSSIDGKIGWTVFDFGAEIANLDELYIWHIRENSGRVAATYNVYVGTSAVAALSHGPDNTSSSVDYDFTSTGWTSVGSGTGTHRGSSVIDLLGNTGRYVAIEIMSSGGDTSRVGFAEVGITAIPEPSAALLGALGTLMLLRRRR